MIYEWKIQNNTLVWKVLNVILIIHLYELTVRVLDFYSFDRTAKFNNLGV